MTDIDLDKRFKEAQAKRNQIAAFVKTTENNSEAGENQQSDLFKLWTIQPGNSVYIRFFPDPDENNPVYWRPKAYHRLQFTAIRQPDGTLTYPERPVNVDVPGWNCKANEAANNNLSKDYLLYSVDDPVQKMIKDLFNGDDASKELYRKLKVKTQYMMYGIITRYEAHPEFVGKAYRFIVVPQLFDIIRDNLSDEDYSTTPCDVNFGYDFKVTMSKQGEFNDYKSSKFTPQSKYYAVTDEMNAEFASHHFKPLQEWLMKVPTPEQSATIEKMTQAVMTNEPFEAAWANDYMPYGYHLHDGFLVLKENNNNTETTVKLAPVNLPTPAQVVKPVVEAPAPVVVPTPANPIAALTEMAQKAAEPVVDEAPFPVEAPAPVVAPTPVAAPTPVKTDEAPKPVPANTMGLADVLAALNAKK